MKINHDCYVYGHYLDGELKYVGKGRKNRAWTFLQRSKGWNAIFKDLKPEVRILHANLDELKAFEKESEEIAKALRNGCKLVNVASGGVSGWDKRASKILSEMRSGSKHWAYGKNRSEETKQKIILTKQANPEKSIARPWLGKKRDPQFMKRFIESSNTPEALEKKRLSRIGKNHSEEHKQKISESLKNVERTKEWNQNISKAKKGKPNVLKGKPLSESHKKAISEATKGRRALTPEEQAKRLATWKKRGMTSSKAKAVLCVDTGLKYRSAKEAAEDTGSDAKHIQACCVGRRKTHNKFRWEYI